MTTNTQADVAGDGSTPLGSALRTLRQRAGLNQMELATRTGLSQSQISRSETDRRLLSAADVGRVADACGADAEERARLVALAESLVSRHVDGRAILQRGAHHFQLRVRQYEEDSTLIRVFQPGMVIGSLQSPGYVRAVFADRAARTQEELDQLVSERLKRAELMDDPVRRWELIHTEGALSWCLGGPAIMLEQMDRLLKVSERPTVDLGIIPSFTPIPFCAHHGFSIHDADVVQIGTRSGTALLTDREDVVEYADLFNRISQAAVHGDEARTVIIRLRETYRSRL